MVRDIMLVLYQLNCGKVLDQVKGVEGRKRGTKTVITVITASGNHG